MSHITLQLLFKIVLVTTLFYSPENRNGVDYQDDQSVIVSTLLMCTLNTLTQEKCTHKNKTLLVLRSLC